MAIAVNGTAVNGTEADAIFSEMAVRDFNEAFLASVLLLLSSMFGHIAMLICDMSRKSFVMMQYIKYKNIATEDLMRQMPESVSKTIHETSSPHGRAFQSFILLSGLLMLQSAWPMHEYVVLSWSTTEITIQTIRWLCPIVGIILLVFIPMSSDYVQMIEHFKRPGYDISPDDIATALVSNFQENMHNAAGTLAFAVTVALEGFFVGREFVQFFKGDLGSPELVRWQTKNKQMYLWLSLLVARTFALLGAHAGLWSMAYEWFGEPTNRVARNPYFLYSPEKGLIKSLLNYMALVAISMWFVNDAAFRAMSDDARIFLSAFAVVAMAAVCFYTICVMVFVSRKDKYLNRHDMEKWLVSVRKDTEEKAERLKPKVLELRSRWSSTNAILLSSSEEMSQNDCC